MRSYADFVLCAPAIGCDVLADDEQAELAVLCAWRGHDVDELDIDIAGGGDLELLARLRADANDAEWVGV